MDPIPPFDRVDSGCIYRTVSPIHCQSLFEGALPAELGHFRFPKDCAISSQVSADNPGAKPSAVEVTGLLRSKQIYLQRVCENAAISLQTAPLGLSSNTLQPAAPSRGQPLDVRALQALIEAQKMPSKHARRPDHKDEADVASFPHFVLSVAPQARQLTTGLSLNDYFPSLALLFAHYLGANFSTIEDLDVVTVTNTHGLHSKFIPYICFELPVAELASRGFRCFKSATKRNGSHCVIVPTCGHRPFLIEAKEFTVPSLHVAPWTVHCINLVAAAEPVPPTGDYSRDLFGLARVFYDHFHSLSASSFDDALLAAKALVELHQLHYTSTPSRDHILLFRDAMVSLASVAPTDAVLKAVQRLELELEPRKSLVIFSDELPAVANDVFVLPPPEEINYVDRASDSRLLPIPGLDFLLPCTAIFAASAFVKLSVPVTMFEEVQDLVKADLLTQIRMTFGVPPAREDMLQLVFSEPADDDDSRDDKLGLRVLLPALQPADVCFAALFKPTKRRHFNFWHRVVIVVEKYLTLLRAQVVRYKARFMFMYFDETANVELAHVLAQKDSSILPEHRASWITRAERSLRPFETKHRLSVVDGVVTAAPASSGQYFLLFSWSAPQLHSFINTISAMFRDSVSRGGFHLRPVETNISF
eukprot:m.11416 g.11416  ORF g.11416 m.11416 type:complete len:646 (-) comp2628_c0_seq1:8-1945(-)